MTLPTNKACALADELLPCPFCGSAVELRPAYYDGDVDSIGHLDHSGDCGLDGFTGFNIAQPVITAWNTRTPPPDSGREAGLEEAAKMLDELEASICGSCEWDEAQQLAFREAARQVRALKSTAPAPIEPGIEREALERLRYIGRRIVQDVSSIKDPTKLSPNTVSIIVGEARIVAALSPVADDEGEEA